ncbi:GDYXXLXY domain-containing protein [Brevibacillus sp. H7]|uniref:GDYXXLXY domain-containing protein n=1 Tax=Brevibacillus sp. H7 TaxID=3349138 RepID=UPI003813EF46
MTKRLFLHVALQIVLLLTIVGKYHYIAGTGQLITLKTAPVDPRDLFYGDYVILNYEISQVERGSVKTDLREERNGPFTVYVLVEKRSHPWYEAAGVFENKPVPNENQAVLRAKLNDYDPKSEMLYLSYGLERYYVPENTGREWEDRREELTLVDVRVTGSGEAVIDRLRMEK